MPQATELVSEWLDEHPDARLVVIDVLAKVRPMSAPGVDRYEADYRILSELKRLADHHRVAVVVVTHTRKLGAEDVFDTVSGSVGLTAAADSTIVLRRARNETAGSLSITGRDVPECEYAVQFDGDRSTWTLDGQELADAARKAAEVRATAGLGDRSSEIVAHVNAHPDGVRAVDVERDLEIPDARRYLARLADAGRIEKAGRGLYKGCVPTIPSVPLPLTDGTDGIVGTLLCTGCGEPLDPWLTDQDATAHVGCEVAP